MWCCAWLCFAESGGFFRYHRAKTEALLAGVPVESILEVEDAWVRGKISWREAVRRLEKLALRAKRAKGE